MMIKDFNTDGAYRWTNINDILSYGAPFNFLNTVRDTGKTTACKIRAYKRFMRKRKGVIWVRRIEEDTIRTRKTFLNSKFFKLTGADPERVRIKGNYAEVLIGKTWERFVEFVTLSKAKSERSADDPERYDLMVLDEGFVSRDKRAFYKGDEVQDFFDLFDSKRRNGYMQALILGNRESVANPYLAYFGIESPPFDFNGIMRYRDNTIIYMQRTTPPPSASDFDEKVATALAGTKYGNFKYNGVAKGVDYVHVKKRPRNTKLYVQFDFGTPMSAYYNSEDAIFFERGVDLSRLTVCSRENAYKKSLVYKGGDRREFSLLLQARKYNKIFYDDYATAESVMELFDKMGL